MKKALLLAFAMSTSTVLVQARMPVPSVTSATLDKYRSEYQQSPLCSKDEITLWSCKTTKSAFSLCSSQVGTRTTGYLQYRVANSGKVTFSYPRMKVPPRGFFKYQSSANGDASVEFTNNGYNYELIDPLRGHSLILVSTPGSSAKTTEIACGANQTLQVNYTMRLMYDFGVWSGD